VVGRPDSEWGETVVAFVVPADGAAPPPVDELDRTCLDRIARFKRPRDYRFVDALPTNNYGKVVKRELHDRLRAEVEAYAALYAQAVAADLKRVGIDPDRRAVRQDIVDRAKDLVELEAKLEELGADADPAMRTRARALREALEKDCVKAKLPLGIVRLRRASTAPPVPLPTAKVVSG